MRYCNCLDVTSIELTDVARLILLLHGNEVDVTKFVANVLGMSDVRGVVHNLLTLVTWSESNNRKAQYQTSCE